MVFNGAEYANGEMWKINSNVFGGLGNDNKDQTQLPLEDSPGFVKTHDIALIRMILSVLGTWLHHTKVVILPKWFWDS